MTSPNDIRDYFANMVASSNTNPNFVGGLEIKSFHYGDSRRIIEKTRSDIEYPALWLEVPSYALSDNEAGDFNQLATISFVILTNTEIDDYEKTDNILDTNFDIARRVLAQMWADRITMQFSFSLNNVLLESIATWLVDNDYGWRVEINNFKTGFFDICPLY